MGMQSKTFKEEEKKSRKSSYKQRCVLGSNSRNTC